MAKRHNRLRIVFFVLFALTVITRMFFEGGDSPGGVWNILQGLFVVSGLFTVIRYPNLLANNSSLRTFVLFSLYIWLLSLTWLSELRISNIFRFVVVPYGAMTMALFTYLGKEKDITDGSWIIVIAYYIFAAQFIIKRNAGFYDDEAGTMVANAYYVACLLPLALVYHPKKLSFIPILVAIIVILFSSKRTGLLAIGAMSVIYYIGVRQPLRKTLGNMVAILVIILVASYAMTYFRTEFEVDTFSRMENLSEDGGSGRDARWRFFLTRFTQSSSTEMIFGHGAGSCYRIKGNAHNDFIQVLFEYGIFAVVLYILFYVKLFVAWLKMKRRHYPYAKHFLMTTVCALFMANFSFFIVEPRIIACSVVCWGMLLADWNKYRLQM